MHILYSLRSAILLGSQDIPQTHLDISGTKKQCSVTETVSTLIYNKLSWWYIVVPYQSVLHMASLETFGSLLLSNMGLPAAIKSDVSWLPL